MTRSLRTAVPSRVRSRTAVARVRRTPRIARARTRPSEDASEEAALFQHADPVEALIQKHAPARAAHTRMHFPLGYAVATGLVVLLVIFSWWMTLDRNLQAQRRGVDAGAPGVTEIIQGGMTQFQNTPVLPPITLPTTPAPRTPSSFEQRLQNTQTP